MPYQVLARKYRPLRFSDVAGQDHVTRTLQNALEQGRIAHGYIFSGHRGIGKTTIARILASALNCQRTIGSPERPTPEPCLACDSCLEIRQGNAVDVIEIDAATNRGIDEIRELRDAARYRPARDRYKIYILDEAHQITDAAFNALLKTLEEPPEHIVFMMATTEPENIPQTIRSRCQHFSFHAVKLDDILGQLRKIAIDENVLADDAALDLLAEAGDGSMRDALSIMDQAIASAPVVQDNGVSKPQLSAAEIRDLMGSVPNTVFEEILEHVSANSASGVLTTANRLLDAGNSPAQIARQFVRYLRNTVVAKIANLTPDSPDTELLQISPDERRRAARTAMLFTEEELTRFMQVMLRTFDDLGFRQEQRFHLELGLLKLVHLQRLLPMEQFLSQLPRPDPTRRIATPTPAPTKTSTPPPSASSAPASAPPAPQPTVSAPTTPVPHVLRGHGSASTTITTPPQLSEGPGFSPVIQTPTKTGASAPEANPPAPTTPPPAQPKLETVAAPVPHIPQGHGIPSPAPDTTRADPSEGPAFSPVIQTPDNRRASAPEAKPAAPSTPPPPQLTVSAPTTPVRHVLRGHGNASTTPSSHANAGEVLQKPAEATTVSARNPSEGPGFSPVIQTPTKTGASAPEAKPADPNLPPIDSYELDALNAPDPEAQPTPSPNTDASTLQAAAVEALFAAGSQNSAAEQLEETTWSIADGEVRIQTSLSKPLMNTIFRADSQAIIRGAIAGRGGAGLRLNFLPGSVADKPKAPKKPRTGSAQAKALEHPTVRAAQRLFNAEVTSVFDLRKD